MLNALTFPDNMFVTMLWILFFKQLDMHTIRDSVPDFFPNLQLIYPNSVLIYTKWLKLWGEYFGDKLVLRPKKSRNYPFTYLWARYIHIHSYLYSLPSSCLIQVKDAVMLCHLNRCGHDQRAFPGPLLCPFLSAQQKHSWCLPWAQCLSPYPFDTYIIRLLSKSRDFH